MRRLSAVAFPHWRLLAVLGTLVALASVWWGSSIQGSKALSVGPNGYAGSHGADPPITVDAGWSTFFWFGPGQPFNSDGPFTFTSLGPVTVKVTDDFCRGDQFRVYDFGTAIGDTSFVPPGACDDVGPDNAFTDPSYSSGSFLVASGSHSLTLQTITNPFGAGGAYLRVDSAGPTATPTPCPTTGCPTATNTPTGTDTPTPTYTPTPCPTSKVPTFGGCGTPTPTPTPTGTPTATPTPCPASLTSDTVDCFTTENLWHMEMLASVPGMSGTMLAFNQGCTGPQLEGCNYNTGGRVAGNATSPSFSAPDGATLTFTTARVTENACGTWDRTVIIYSTNGGTSYAPLVPLVGAISAGGQFLASSTAEICGTSTTAQTVSVQLPPGTTNMGLSFDSGDAILNDFAGQFIDDVHITPCPSVGCPTPTPTATTTPTDTPTFTPTPCPTGKVIVGGGCGTFTPTDTPTFTPTPCPTGKAPAFGGGCGTPTPPFGILPGLDFSVGVGAQCDSTAGPAKCVVPVGGTFTLDYKLNSIPAGFSYDGYDFGIIYSGVVPNPASLVQQGGGVWPACVFSASSFSTPGVLPIGCAFGIGAQPSSYTGIMAHVDFQCPLAGVATITLRNVPRIAENTTQVVDDNFQGFHEAADESLTINCLAAPPTVTPTATPTPLPQPRIAKLPALQNVFLHKQGAKLPPQRCEESTDVATLEETIMSPIVSQDPKGHTGLQQLGAYEFTVRYDPRLVCVAIAPGPAWVAAGAICTALPAEGLIHYGCVTAGKGHGLNSAVITEPMAVIKVRPQPELYSQLRPNQDNGIPVQIQNSGCELSDEQGHPIDISSCEDADVTFRYLEGDVTADCLVDVMDAQQVAFRWGSTLGSLLYAPFMDLEPSGQVNGDGDIDIKDLQFVFGRLGSTCASPWPPQLPVNPKA